MKNTHINFQTPWESFKLLVLLDKQSETTGEKF